MTNTFDKNNVNKNIVNKNNVNKNIVNKNIVLCGVGGQGTVLASKLIAAAAMDHRHGPERRQCLQQSPDR